MSLSCNHQFSFNLVSSPSTELAGFRMVVDFNSHVKRINIDPLLRSLSYQLL